SISNFASPYGEYFGAGVLDDIRSVYGSHRTVESGFNYPRATDPYRLQVQNVLNTTSVDQVQSWVNQARSSNTWLILVFHNIVDSPTTYDSSPSMFNAYLDRIASSGISVRTVRDALSVINN
ncbi:MAG: hypothetical protein AB7Q27_15960, partial [Acidimicrobiia bacterium]